MAWISLSIPLRRHTDHSFCGWAVLVRRGPFVYKMTFFPLFKKFFLFSTCCRADPAAAAIWRPDLSLWVSRGMAAALEA